MNILVASANGYGNAGDDMCALMAQTFSRRVGGKVKVKVTAPPFNQELADWADALVLGGGGIIYDANKDNMENYLAYIDYGLTHDKLTVGLGLGEQGIVTEAGEQRYKEAFNKMDLLTVRSKLDAARLEGFGVKTAEATQDLAFGFDYHRYKSVSHLRKGLKHAFFVRRKPKLGVVLSNQEHLVTDLKLAFSKEEKVNALHFKNSFEKNIDAISKAFDLTIITQSRDDLEMAEAYAQEHGVRAYSYKSENDLHKLLRVYGSQDLILTQRFHGLVFSFMLDIPVVGLGYHGQKQYKLLKDMGLVSKLSMYHKPEQLEELLQDLAADSDKLQKYVIRLDEKHHKYLKNTSDKNQNRLAQILNKT